MKRGRVTERERESLRSPDIALNDEKHTEKLLIHLSVWFVGPALCWIRIKNALEWECVFAKNERDSMKNEQERLWKIFELLSRHELNAFQMLWTKKSFTQIYSAEDKKPLWKCTRLQIFGGQQNANECIASERWVRASENNSRELTLHTWRSFFAKRYRRPQWRRHGHRMKEKYGESGRASGSERKKGIKFN